MTSLNRRRFLKLSSGALAVGAIGSVQFASIADALAAAQGTTDGDQRTLVVVDMQGGNDALNTFVPQSGIYRDVRPTLALPESDLLTFRNLDYGVHKSLEPLQSLWDSGQFAAIYGTGLEGQGRSHFVAQDAWRSARPERTAQSGWIGRWVEASPLDEPVPLRTVALGQSMLAAQGVDLQPVAVQSLTGIDIASPTVAAAVLAMSEDEAPDAPDLFAQVQAATPRMMDAIDDLQDLIGSVEVADDVNPDADGSLFEATTQIIQGNAGAQVIYVTVDGFDTHAGQLERQEFLLDVVATGLADMFEALEESGHAENTLAMVVSEFGRRVAQNGSAGTDHGRGGLSFLLGPPVKETQLIGEPDLTDLIDGDLQITTDARTLYDSALRWLGASSDQVVEVLGDEWRDDSLLKA